MAAFRIDLLLAIAAIALQAVHVLEAADPTPIDVPGDKYVIIYSPSAVETAKKVAVFLKAKNIPVWIDTDNPKTDHNVAGNEKAIDTAKKVIVVFDQHYVDPKAAQFKTEVQYAFSKGKDFLPIKMFKGATPPQGSWLPYAHSGAAYYNFEQQKDAFLEEFFTKPPTDKF